MPPEVLKTFLTDEIIENIVKHTNAYAYLAKQTPAIQEQMKQNKRSLFNLWKGVTKYDIWCYIAIQILMGVIKNLTIILIGQMIIYL